MGGGSITDIYVPIGNYNAYTLSASLMFEFLANRVSIVISVSPQTGLMSFSDSSASLFIYPYQIGDMIFSSIAPVIGLLPDGLSSPPFTCAYPVNLLGTKKNKY